MEHLCIQHTLLYGNLLFSSLRFVFVAAVCSRGQTFFISSCTILIFCFTVLSSRMSKLPPSVRDELQRDYKL